MLRSAGNPLSVFQTHLKTNTNKLASSLLKVQFSNNVRNVKNIRSLSHKSTNFKLNLNNIASIGEKKNNNIIKNYGRVSHYSTFNSSSTSSTSGDNANKISLYQKVKHFVTFTASGFLILGAAGLAVIVVYLIVSELFLPSGDTHIFNRAVNLVEDDPVSRKLLECNDLKTAATNASDPPTVTKEKLKAYGETIKDDHWTRNRPIQSMRKVGADGKERYFMRFHVESAKKVGSVYVEAKESETKFQPEFVVIYLDVPGKRRHYLLKPAPKPVARPTGFLGVNWGPKK